MNSLVKMFLSITLVGMLYHHVNAFIIVEQNQRTTILPSSTITTTMMTSSSSPITTISDGSSSSNSMDEMKYHEESLIDDGHGHIKSEIAGAIWNWDHQHRMNNTHDNDASTTNSMNDDKTKFKYSTRKGLRLVDDIAKELLKSNNYGKDTVVGPSANIMQDEEQSASSSSTLYSDLIQEGVVALMYAMSNYDPQKAKNRIDTEKAFENYAKRTIYNNMIKLLADNTRPIRLPKNVDRTLRNAKRATMKLQSELGRNPTIQEVADTIGEKVENLQLYQSVSRNTISVEGTLSVESDGIDSLNDYDLMDTAATDDDDIIMNTKYSDEEEWEYEQQHPRQNVFITSSRETTTPTSSTDNNGGPAEQLIEIDMEFHDEEEMYETDGDDEMFYNENQFIMPLKDAIPDDTTNNPKPDDVVLQNLIHDDVDSFLISCLNEQELQIIKMRFGIHFDTDNDISSNEKDNNGNEEKTSSSGSDGGMSFDEISKQINLSPSRIRQIELYALDKLRTSYKNKYVESYLDDEHESIEDSL